ncbi:redoxin domain-containing protein [Halobacterium bonnevillei]|uniref:thioredoxin-dependent peroxiredoxin n=1 Tax=Halobacterium bonnevillei TaxID=2692200 RepID=A0A6B0STE9_9EURY|nr:redoxin domain-containing protein [Halobacterium bonnevillei]MXR20849.1 redoxin domain-containing protein [Halobacterium bonnevillei]
MGSEDALRVGEEVPATTAPLVYPDGGVEETALSELYEDTPVLVVFYTNDFSPDCVTEWCSFRDYAWFTSSDEVRVVGSSKSREGTHRRFSSYLDLDFPLFSDRDLEVSDAFGVTYRTFKVFPRSKRSVFLVDADGVVRYRWIGDHPLDPTRDQPPLAEIREAVEELSGEEPETFGFN